MGMDKDMVINNRDTDKYIIAHVAKDTYIHFIVSHTMGTTRGQSHEVHGLRV